MDKRFWLIIGVIVAIFAGVLFFKGDKNSGSTGSTSSSGTPTNHVAGKLDSKVTLLEYGDYQCPACESFNPTVDAIREKYKDTIKFQFRNLPLSQVHPNAFAAARAAEAAALQNKFWEMHDALYETSNWSQWTVSSTASSYFEQYASQLGLNVDQFKKDFASSKVNATVNADLDAFNKTGKEKSTPTFFLNGEYIDNNTLLGSDRTPSVDAFSKLIDAALAKNQ